MCYSEETLSAFADGELNRAMMSEVSEHLESCDRCRSVVRRIETVNDVLQSTKYGMQYDLDTGRDEVWRRVQARIRRERKKSPVPVWRRNIVVPVPLAAGTLFTVCLLLAALLFTPGAILPDDTSAVIAQQTHAEIETAALSGDESLPELEKLVRFLSEQGAAVEVKIELPSSSRFEVIGEPQLMKAADYRKGEEK